MATRKLLLWFERRRKSETLNLAQAQILQAINTVKELEKALKALSQSEIRECEAAIQSIFPQQVKVDTLRRAVFTGLTKDDFPAKYCEDLKGLVGRVDVMADHVKDSARSVKILLKTTVPRDILDEFVEVAKDLSACATALGDCIEMLGVNPAMVIELAKKVDEFEEKVDDRYVDMQLLFFKHATTVDPATFLGLRDLIGQIEHAADQCANTADYLRVLAAEETVI